MVHMVLSCVAGCSFMLSVLAAILYYIPHGPAMKSEVRVSGPNHHVKPDELAFGF